MELATATVSVTYLWGKIYASISALLGGLFMAVFFMPKKLSERGKLAAGVMVGGMSTTCGFIFVGILANVLGMDATQLDVGLPLGFIIGMMSLSVITWMSNFLSKRENADILDVIDEVKSRRPAAKKAVRKVRAGVKK